MPIHNGNLKIITDEEMRLKWEHKKSKMRETNNNRNDMIKRIMETYIPPIQSQYPGAKIKNTSLGITIHIPYKDVMLAMNPPCP